MKSLRPNFIAVQKRYPFWGDVICFAEAVHGKNFSYDTIRRWFNELVNKEEYEAGDKKDLLLQFEQASSVPRGAPKIKGKRPVAGANRFFPYKVPTCF